MRAALHQSYGIREAFLAGRVSGDRPWWIVTHTMTWISMMYGSAQIRTAQGPGGYLGSTGYKKRALPYTNLSEALHYKSIDPSSRIP